MQQDAQPKMCRRTTFTANGYYSRASVGGRGINARDPLIGLGVSDMKTVQVCSQMVSSTAVFHSSGKMLTKLSKFVLCKTKKKLCL